MKRHTRLLIMNIVLVSLLFSNCFCVKRTFATAPDEGTVYGEYGETVFYDAAAGADVETTTQPVIPTDPPIETTTEPVVPTDPPIETTTEPVIPTDPPIETTTEPVIPTDPPIETTIEPVTPVDPSVGAPDAPKPGEREPGTSENTVTPTVSDNAGSASENAGVSKNSVSSPDVVSGDLAEDNEGDPVEKEKKRMPEVISLTMPVLQTDNYVFDYIMDPYGYINETGAVKYDEKNFEEGGTLFFKNTPQNEGDSESYSATSDFLKVVNKSTVSVDLTISLNIVKNEEIKINEDPQFAEDNAASMYMAITDREGNTVSADSEGKATLTMRLEPAPEDAYKYEYNEETGEYEILSSNETEGYDEFEFAVKGACNPNGNWDSIMDIPEISVAWEAAPLMGEGESISENGTVSDNNGVSGNSPSGNNVSDNTAPEKVDPEDGSGEPGAGGTDGEGVSKDAVPGSGENGDDQTNPGDGSGSDGPGGENGQNDPEGSKDDSDEGKNPEETDVVSPTTEDTPVPQDVKTMMMDVNQLDVIVREVYEVERSKQKVEPAE